MSFYSSQFDKKTSRYCNSSLYGTNLSSVYADGPPPLDDTLEEDDGDMVFKDNGEVKRLPGHENEKESEANSPPSLSPWTKNDSSQDNGEPEFGGFADFSSAFSSANETKSRNDSSWFEANGPSTGTIPNQWRPEKVSTPSTSQSKGVSKSDDPFGCFSGDDDDESNDFDDFQNFASSDQSNSNTDISTDSHQLENADKNNSARFGDELGKENPHKDTDKHSTNTLDIHVSSLPQHNDNQFDTKISSLDDDFDNFHSTEQHSSSNVNSDHQNNHISMQKNNTESNKKIPVFSDDDDDDSFGEFNASSCDEDSRQVADTSKTHGCGNPSTDETKNLDSASMDKESTVGDITRQADKAGNLNSLTINDFHQSNNGSFSSQTDNAIEEDSSSQPRTIDNSEPVKEVKNINNSNVESVNQIKDLGDLSTHKFGVNGICDDDDNDDFGQFSMTSPNCSVVQDKPGEIKSSEKNDLNNVAACSVSADVEHLQSQDKLDDNTGPQDDGFDNFAADDQLNKQLPCEDDDDDFGDFAAVFQPTKQQPSCKDNDGDSIAAVSPHIDQPPKEEVDDDDDFGDFAEVPPLTEQQPSCKDDDDSDDDDFGDFAEVPPLTEQQAPCKDDDAEFGDFAAISQPFRQQPPCKDDDDDDDFSGFAQVSPPTEQQSSKDDDDDFGNFAAVSHPQEQKSQDSAGFHSPSSSSPSFLQNKEIKSNISTNDDDDFSHFGSASSSTKGFAHFESSNDSAVDFADFSLNQPSKSFGDFSSMAQKSPQTSPTPTSVSKPNFGVSTFQRKENKSKQQSLGSSKMDHGVIYYPERNTPFTRISNPIKLSFTDQNLTIEESVTIQGLQHQIESAHAIAWQQIRATARDGSLRFEWVLSDHQVRMLESLSMLPVRIQTSASFRSGGQGPTPLFATGLGLLEPVKGVITPFHHGIEDIDPSQDPFGAPPEVGVSDLGFGRNVKKETLLSQSDNISDSISVSSSLDLDFLAPSNTSADTNKSEGRGLYEDDLLGLGMQFTKASESPKIFNNRDQNKVFKFNTTAVSPGVDTTSLGPSARKLVDDFEDLSFMVSKVLMFPLKTKD